MLKRWRHNGGPVREKPALNETRPPAAIAKRRVVFRVMNAELNNMRCRHATSTADMPPDGFSSSGGSASLIEPFERGRCTLSPRFIAPDQVPSASFSAHASASPFFPLALPFPWGRPNNRARFTWTRARARHKPPARLLPLSHVETAKKISFFASLSFSAILGVLAIFIGAPASDA